jgi:hypothetical protein
MAMKTGPLAMAKETKAEDSEEIVGTADKQATEQMNAVALAIIKEDHEDVTNAAEEETTAAAKVIAVRAAMQGKLRSR